jgi:hypothetical protein
MTRAEAIDVVAFLNAAFPRDALERESVEMWVADLESLSRHDAAMEAAVGFRRESPSFPPYSDFRNAYRAAVKRLTAGRELEEAFEPVPPPAEFVETWEKIKAGGSVVRSFDDAPIPETAS